MNAAEFFQIVVKGNYEQFTKCPGDLRLLWNSVVATNTVAEYVAVERHGYAEVSREALAQTAKQIRDEYPSLSDLKFCADTFKHVRKIEDHKKKEPNFTTIATSSGVSADDRTTWTLKHYDLVDVLQRAVHDAELLCTS